MKLIPITEQTHDVELQLAYATRDNFTGQPIYRRAECFLHTEAEICLQRAIELARPLGLRLRIFDAFRPQEAQWQLWQYMPNPEFVADPRQGSSHSRAIAVDLTLVDRASGQALDMGTPFDDFTAQSHHGRRDISLDAQRNRLLLLGLMTAAGWDYYTYEWWHYNLFNPRHYPLLGDAVLDGHGLMRE